MTATPEKAPTHIWNGIFPTWKDASSAAIEGGGGFESDRWLDRITGQLEDYRAGLRDHGIALPPRPSNLPWVAAVSGATSITDFGGSSGWAYDYLRNTLPHAQIQSYVIVEIERIVAHMNKSGLQSPPVVYRSAQEALDRSDLLYCNSVLQYFESNSELLALIEKTSPAHVLLDDVLGKGVKDFFSTQGYYGAALPHRFIGVGRLVADMAAAGYELLLTVPFASPVLGVLKPLPMENLPAEYRITHAVSLLFRRLPVK